MVRVIAIKQRSMWLGILCAVLTATPVLADDTEIFFSNPVSDETENGRPNVLFILDTSGSMRTEVGDTNQTRMQHMQDALNQILDSTTDVNVGLMRFNDPGGPILFPVSNIDAELTEVTPTTSAPSVESRIRANADDAEESAGVVTLDSGRLEVVYVGGESGVYSRRINDDDNDAEETISNGDISLNGNTFNMQASQINGLRFTNTAIPAGATIQSAYLTFTSKANSTGAVTFQFKGELHRDPGKFRNANKNISKRSQTAASVNWVVEDWVSGSEYTSPDISTIIQEIVNQSDWSEDDLAIVQKVAEGTGTREAYTYDSSSSRAVKLDINWQLGTPASQTVGLRFTDVGIPQGAEITSAVIEFTAAQSTSGAYTTGLTVEGIAEDDAAVFTTSASNISGRTATVANVIWQPNAWTDGDVVQTPELKTVVQAVVDRSGWCGNNAMGFRISGPDAVNRVAHSYEGNPEFAPVLRVTYDTSAIPVGGGCMNQTLVYRVKSSESDAEQSSDNSVSTSGNVFNMNSSQTNGLRFEGVKVSQGAKILEANLYFTAEAADTSTTALTFKGHLTGNSSAFVNTAGNISGRGTTTASVSWSPGSWTRGYEYSTPDLSTVIQEIVDQGGWQAGNALSIIQTGSSGERRAYTYNNQPANAPLLKLKVQHGGVTTGGGKLVRTRLKELVNEFVPSGYTPIVDTLYEAANYYRGGPVLYGKKRGAQTTYGRVSHPDSYTGGTVYRQSGCTDDNLNASACSNEEIQSSPQYVSPIAGACQTNHVVLLTDGEANHNNSIDRIKTLTSKTSCDPATGGEACGRELADWLATEDHSATLSQSQTVKTYTIGFNLDEGGQAGAIKFLQDLSVYGGGNYYSASTSAELANAFQRIIRSIMNTDTTFVSPGATVNQFNRLTHQNDIYFSLFKPATRPAWPGNLKRYELKGSPAIIVDQNGNPAVNAATGFFASSSQSFWSDSVDGNKVEQGGAADELSLVNRKVYTYTGTSTDLTDTTNVLSESNAAITKTMLNIDSESDIYRTNLLKWSRGVDVKDEDDDSSITDIRAHIGAPLHSQAVVITYGGTAANPDTTLFFGTNEGYLHAINTSDGSERFAFVPQQLLGNLNEFYVNGVATSLPYGLDGPLTYWVKDVDGDHIIESGEGDHVYLYAGMRRGGRHLYALDVTDRDAPLLKWVISGGSGDFAELGQTWSMPVQTRVKIGSDFKNVLIFAGGYDQGQDARSTRSPDSMGRAIYIVDAATGGLLWSGGPVSNPNGTYTQTFADMNYSIPSDIRVIDINTDGLADQMYVGDTGGQLWRFDIVNGAAAGSLITGGVIGDFALNSSGDNDAANNRRFYYAPDVAMIRKGTERYLSIAIGSGWRAHPLNTIIQDRFYQIRLNNVYNSPATYTKMTEANLYDATANLIGTSTGTALETELSKLYSSSQGWYIKLENSGEKVLAEALTINNQILFTTYAPTSGSSCSAGRGQGRLYIVSALDATPVLNLDKVGDDDALTKSDRSTELARNGIPPKPTVLFPDADGTAVPDPLLCVGAECGQDLNFGQIMERTFWRDVEQ